MRASHAPMQMIMTCASVFVGGIEWLSVVQFTGAVLLVYMYLRWLPYLHATVNCVRVAAYSSILWAASILVILAFQPGVDPNDDNAVHEQRWAMCRLGHYHVA